MTSPAARTAFPWLVVVGILVAALSLRSPIVAPTPVLRDISADLGIDAGTAGLITTAPVLMFALMTPVAAMLIRRSGTEAALMTTLVGVVVGSFLRALPGFGWLLAGMVVIGAAITIGNVVVPVVIRREVPPQRVATVTAAYTAAINVGSLVASLATAPLAALVGWNAAILTWTGLAVLGAAVWGWHMRSRARAPRPSSAPAAATAVATASEEITALTGPTPVLAAAGRTGRVFGPVTVLLLVAFGMQSATYYSLTTWLPAVVADSGGADASAAGALASVFQGVAVFGAFLVPALNRVVAPSVTAAVIAGCWVATAAGLAYAPQLLVLWICIGGVAQAGGFVVVFSTLARAARSDAEAAGMSAVVQGGGYLLSCAGPPAVGLVHDLAGTWSAALSVLVGTTSVFAVSLIAATLLLRRGR